VQVRYAHVEMWKAKVEYLHDLKCGAGLGGGQGQVNCVYKMLYTHDTVSPQNRLKHGVWVSQGHVISWLELMSSKWCGTKGWTPVPR
jgi:hypothetical protein